MSGLNLLLGGLENSLEACGHPAGVLDKEQNFVSSLRQIERFEIVGEMLVPYGESGPVILAIRLD